MPRHVSWNEVISIIWKAILLHSLRSHWRNQCAALRKVISPFTFHGSLQSNYLLLICNLCLLLVINQLPLRHACVCVCVRHLVTINLPGGDVENCGLHPSELLHFHELEEGKKKKKSQKLVKAKSIHSRVVKYMFNSSIQSQRAATKHWVKQCVSCWKTGYQLLVLCRVH